MKLYLSSYRLPNVDGFTELVGKEASQTSIGLVLNAQDYKSKDDREAKKAELVSYFSARGFSVGEIDLRRYDKTSTVQQEMKQHDVVWFNGGNIYCLRHVIAESPMTTSALKDVLRSGVVYAGDSAGAILAGPTLKYFDAADDPSVAPETMEEGLGLVDFVVIPHCDSEKYGKTVSRVKERLDRSGYTTKPLTDDEYVIVE